MLAFAPLLVQSPTVATFTIAGVKRVAQVHPGTGRAPAAGRPLVLAFHGHGGTMRSAARSFAAHEAWPEALTIYPEGLPSVGRKDAAGERNGWQKQPGALGARDLNFVDGILASTKGYDPRRVYAMGHSNGGRMVYVLWAARRDKFAAFGPSGSPAIRPYSGLKPAPFLATIGENDPIVSPTNQRRGVQALAAANGVDLAKAAKTGFLTLGKGTHEAGLYLHPGEHGYPREAGEATIALFRRTSR